MGSIATPVGRRQVGPDEVLAMIRPVLPRVGVTRLADVTWLDDVGIPCFQAIRPNARTLAVSQGKGLTPALAAVSAGMEAIEVWHAENLADGPRKATVARIESELGYPVSALRCAEPRTISGDTVLDWTPARRLVDDGETFVPTDLLRMDSTVEQVWDPMYFEVTSNGLASGATVGDAILHGLCEVIERDALARPAGPRPRLDLATAGDQAAWLVQRFRSAGVEVIVEVIESPVGLPCFLARAFSVDFPVEFHGSAANVDPAAAVCTALAEAAQARVAAIAGTREDLGARLYEGDQLFGDENPAFSTESGTSPVPLPAHYAVDGSVVDSLAARVATLTGYSPLVVDLTRPDIGIPVVRVICPGTRCAEDY